MLNREWTHVSAASRSGNSAPPRMRSGRTQPQQPGSDLLRTVHLVLEPNQEGDHLSVRRKEDAVLVTTARVNRNGLDRQRQTGNLGLTTGNLLAKDQVILGRD